MSTWFLWSTDSEVFQLCFLVALQLSNAPNQPTPMDVPVRESALRISNRARWWWMGCLLNLPPISTGEAVVRSHR